MRVFVQLAGDQHHNADSNRLFCKSFEKIRRVENSLT